MPLVSGQVRDHAGQPVPGVFVTAVPVKGRRFIIAPSTYTGLSGRWFLELPPGEWNIRETGVTGYTLTVGDVPINTSGEPQAATQTAPDPTREDIEALLARRQEKFSPRDDRDVNAPPSETRPIVESPVGDIAAFLRERRGE